ncbi:hypothetical protein [Rugosimonospora africana]|uniref:Uncharacterized protein n=1 Tax=Rugosimonospora africana TaxID=556532 RepID=A0A8J3QX55_9ACTN|nr:hypothetical protein [Rugosimonospora africana]GIH18513.1 hypothetical protein Raf01_66850 [Rugosimonospora africana]
MRERQGRGRGSLGIVVLVLLLVVCVGGIAGRLPLWASLIAGATGVLLVLLEVRRAVAQGQPARAAASAFMDDLVAGQVNAAAYPRHDTQVSDTGTLVIQGLTDEGRQISEYHIQGATIISLGRPRAEVTGWARLSTSDLVPFSLLLSRQADAGWRVVGVSAEPQR